MYKGIFSFSLVYLVYALEAVDFPGECGVIGHGHFHLAELCFFHLVSLSFHHVL